VKKKDSKSKIVMKKSSSSKPKASVPKPASPTPSYTEPVTDPCKTVCQMTKELSCGSSDARCMKACSEMRDINFCQAEMREVFACMTKHPKENWECSEDKVAAIKEGVCDKEQTLFVTCMLSAQN
jgi:hypothetical protein